MKMKNLAVAIALMFGSSLAIATDDTKRSGDRAGASEGAPYGEAKGHEKQKARGATDGAPKGNAATDYWKQHSKKGYMAEEHAMGYKSADGKPMDWKRLDADADGRVSQTEWTGYHGRTVSDGSKDQGADSRGGGGVTGTVDKDSSSGAGAAGPTGSTGAESPSGGSTGGDTGGPKDRDPTSGGRGSN